jgi:hypothetical protein
MEKVLAKDAEVNHIDHAIKTEIVTRRRARLEKRRRPD